MYSTTIAFSGLIGNLADAVAFPILRKHGVLVSEIGSFIYPLFGCQCPAARCVSRLDLSCCVAVFHLAVVDLEAPLAVSALEPAGSLADALHVSAEGLHLLRVFKLLKICRTRLLPCKAVLPLRSAVIVFVEQVAELILADLASCKLTPQRLKVFIRRHFACVVFRLSFLCSFLSSLLCGSFLRRGSLSGLLCRRSSFPRGLRGRFRLKGDVNRAVFRLPERRLIVASRLSKECPFLSLSVPYLGEQVVDKL